VILRSHQLGYVLEQNVVRIAPLKSLALEETEAPKLVGPGDERRAGVHEDPELRAGRRCAKLLKDTRVLSNRGSALVDDRTARSSSTTFQRRWPSART
jgi:hypothetical protein